MTRVLGCTPWALAGAMCLLAQTAAQRCPAQQPCRIQELLPDDLSPRAFYGNDLAADGNWLAASAFKDDDLGTYSGSVYVYRLNGRRWMLHEKLLALDDGQPGAQFGDDVAMDGDWLLATAIFQDTMFNDDGAAYVFSYDGSQWMQFQKLVAPPPHAGPSLWFGGSGAISGNVIAVGATGDDSNGLDSGAVYVFRFNGSQWVFEQKLLASDGQTSDFFAFNHGLAVAGDRIVAATPFHDHNGNVDQGGVYVFRYNGATWVEEAELLPSDGTAGDWFGRSVSISGDRVVVGAPHSGGTGALYVFRFDGSMWIEEERLQAGDAAPGDKMGQEVRILGDTILGGADRNDDNGTDSGSAYIFRFQGGQWVEKTKLLASDGRSGDLFGAAVELLGSYAFVAAPLHDDVDPNGGSVYAYLWEPNDCNGNDVADVCDIDPNDPDGDGQVSGDCNGNGVPDECDISGGTSSDCNGNGVPDECDIDPNDPDGNNQVSDDCNGNAIPDECENTGAVLSVWTGDGDGSSWSDPANWCPAIVPADDPNAGAFFNVLIGPGAQVAADVSVTVSSLDVDPNAQISVNATGGRTLKIREPDQFTNRGRIAVANHGNRLEAAGVVLNSDTITITATQGTASFVPAAAGTVLTGGGLVRLTSTDSAILGSGDGAVSLANEADHTIRGAGRILGNFTNRGLVEADIANETLELRGSGTVRTNSAMLRSVSGATLRISGRLDQDPNAVVEVNGSGNTKVVIGDPNDPNTILMGGTILRTAGRFNVRASARLRNLTVVGGLSVPTGETAVFEGTITNQGTISLGGGSSILVRDVDVTFTGGGEIELRSQGTSALARIESTTPSRTLTQAAGHTIRGVGRISAALVNDGQILASRPAGASPAVLSLAPDAFLGALLLTNNAGARIEARDATSLQIDRPLTNHGQLVATASGIVNINDAVTSDGQIEASAGGTVNIDSPVTGGGSLVVSGGTLRVSTVTDAGCVEVPPNGFAASGTSQLLVQSGSLTAQDLFIRTEGLVQVESGATCDVATNVLLDTGDPDRPPTLRVASGGTLRFGSGPSGGQLTVNAGSARINGGLEAASNDPLDVLIADGTLGGTGLVTANVNVLGGVVDPGRDPNTTGTLTIGRGLAMLGGATLRFELADTNGNHDRITVNGPVQLSGTLHLFALPGFTVASPHDFTLLTAAIITGTFTQQILPPLPSGLTWDIEITTTQVVAHVVAESCPQDLDGDGQVDVTDLSLLLNDFGASGGTFPGDIDGDGDVDLADLAVLLQAFGTTCP